MAYVRVLDYVDIGTGGVHDATSWQFAKDANFTKIIDQSLNDKVNVKDWYSMLPKLEEDKEVPGAKEYYADLDALYCRVKIFVNGFPSDWLVLDPKNQNRQKVIITEQGKPDIETDDVTIGMQ